MSFAQQTLLGWMILASIGCSNKNTAGSAPDFEPAIFEKTLCFGPCPAFLFELHTDGHCDLTITRPFREGKLKDLEPGKYVAEMSDAKSWNDALHSALELTGYHELDDVYDNEHITDLPSTKTTIQGKSITNRYKGPDLDPLYAVLEQGMESLNWQPIETK